MADEVDPNLLINSDLFSSYPNGFKEVIDGEEYFIAHDINHLDSNVQTEPLRLCCSTCTCTNSHSSVPQ